MVQFALQPAHGYIPLLVVGMTFVVFWASMKVGAARKKYGIEYPQMYAEQSDKNAKAFNCVQRAHQNVLEQLPVYFALLFMSAVFRPQAAAIAGLVRLLGLIAYVNGYVTGDPKKRQQGVFGTQYYVPSILGGLMGIRYLGLLASIGLSVEVGLRMLELI